MACRSACKKDPSLALGQACPGSEQEGPARVAQCPHERRSGARGRCLFAHRGKAGVALSRGFLNSLRPTGSWFFPRSARYERAATWRPGNSAGRLARFKAVLELLDYMRAKGGVWFAAARPGVRPRAEADIRGALDAALRDVPVLPKPAPRILEGTVSRAQGAPTRSRSLRPRCLICRRGRLA